MGVRYTLHFWTLALVILPGVLGDNWGVWYSKTEICAVRESTETIRCRYTYPELTVNTNPPGRIKEGDNVNLTCDTTCKLNQSEITLLKNKQDLGLPSLQFNSISYQNSGNYSCALKGNITISSKQMILDVQYPPKSTSVSVSPSGEIVEGSSVTLTCSSDANPRVQSYTWFKENRAVSSKRLKETYTISNMSSEDSGRYHCQAQNEHGVDNSTAVALTVAGNLRANRVTLAASSKLRRRESATPPFSSKRNRQRGGNLRANRVTLAASSKLRRRESTTPPFSSKRNQRRAQHSSRSSRWMTPISTAH
ncbi:B-cell receptor CD22-like isoform X8 [Conger conger]|uniref:B-cell receptor CD22-like isoform X8 n=1 Tax=Conger conger TaxID=82655 RepID=UPI002A5A145E|nr:B-cell receptor CD22-like isoform X8 [Conger conger]